MGVWSTASELAKKTPPERNRYVDFLRAASILFVISGHWLIATAHFTGGELKIVDILKVQPNTQWLSWIFQVMPIFFIVGGYSNAVSLESARAKGVGYADWLAGRLHRLLTPLLLLVLVWAFLSYVLHVFGAKAETIVFASRASLVPTWFLAIYTVIVLLAPLTYAFWRRWGMGSFFVYLALAVVADFLYFQQDIRWVGWTNYFWVWLAVHHLGFIWRDNRLPKPSVLFLLGVCGIGALAALVFLGPYPLAMAGSPDEAVSNSLPPKISLLALGLFQFGLALSLQAPMRRFLSSHRVWTSTVIINTFIMTIYLWHMTILVIVLGISFLLDGFGLKVAPGSGDWWLSRPLWLGTLLILLLPLAMLLSPLERRARPADAPSLAAWRLILGSVMACLGIALLTLFGFDGDPFNRLDIVVLALVLVGAVVAGLKVLPYK